MSTIYIAGPMRGYPDFNFPAFDEAEEQLMLDGRWSRIYSPAEMDRQHGIDPAKMKDQQKWLDDLTDEEFREIFSRDLEAVLDSDAIYMLRGWEKSSGARLEHQLAVLLGLSVFYQDGLPLSRVMKLPPAQDTTRVAG